MMSDSELFASDDVIGFFETAKRYGLIASLALGPTWQPALRGLAQRFPRLTFLCHHMAGARSAEPPPHPNLQEILKSAEVPNIYIKMSGFHYVSQVPWDYPHADVHWVVRELYSHFGPNRLCWGSDYPVVRRAMTHQHALEAFRKHCTFIPDEDKERILGTALEDLLDTAGK